MAAKMHFDRSKCTGSRHDRWLPLHDLQYRSFHRWEGHILCTFWCHLSFWQPSWVIPTAHGLWSSLVILHFLSLDIPNKGTPKRIEPWLNVSFIGCCCSIKAALILLGWWFIVLRISDLQPKNIKNEFMLRSYIRKTIPVLFLIFNPSFSSYGKIWKKKTAETKRSGHPERHKSSWRNILGFPERTRALQVIWMTTSDPLHMSPEKQWNLKWISLISPSKAELPKMLPGRYDLIQVILLLQFLQSSDSWF